MVATIRVRRTVFPSLLLQSLLETTRASLAAGTEAFRGASGLGAFARTPLTRGGIERARPRPRHDRDAQCAHWTERTGTMTSDPSISMTRRSIW